MLIVLCVGLSFLGVWLMVFGVALANAVRDEIETRTLLKIRKSPSPKARIVRRHLVSKRVFDRNRKFYMRLASPTFVVEVRENGKTLYAFGGSLRE